MINIIDSTCHLRHSHSRTLLVNYLEKKEILIHNLRINFKSSCWCSFNYRIFFTFLCKWLLFPLFRQNELQKNEKKNSFHRHFNVASEIYDWNLSLTYTEFEEAFFVFTEICYTLLPPCFMLHFTFTFLLCWANSACTRIMLHFTFTLNLICCTLRSHWIILHSEVTLNYAALRFSLAKLCFPLTSTHRNA